MTGIKRSSKQILPMVIGSTLVLGLIWLNTFIHQNSFSDSYGDFSFLIEIIPAVSLATLLNTLVMFRSAVWQSTYSTADCAQDAAWGAIAMMALLFCEIGGQGNVSSFSYSSVVLGSFTFPKRYIYDFWVIIWFPIQVDAILRAMKHEDFSRDAQQNGFTSLFVMTLEELLFFSGNAEYLAVRSSAPQYVHTGCCSVEICTNRICRKIHPACWAVCNYPNAMPAPAAGASGGG